MAYYARYEPDETGALQKVVYNCGVGFCLPFYGTEAPPGTLACDGSEISREAYKELFAVLGTKAGAGDGSTTFNLPDFRGDFIRCVGGNAAELGVEQGDAIRNITASAIFRVQSTDANVGSIYELASGALIQQATDKNGTFDTLMSRSSLRASQKLVLDASAVVPTAAENRPVNVALLWCIIYE